MDNFTRAWVRSTGTLKTSDEEMTTMDTTEVYSVNTSDTTATAPGTSQTHYDMANSLSLAQAISTVFVILIGIIGNVFSAIIMRRERFKSMSISVFFFVLAIVDSVILVFNQISRRLIGEITGVQITQLSPYICKISAFIMDSMPVLSSWLLVAVSMERTLAVALPYRAKNWFSIKRAWLTVTTLVILVLAMFSFQLYSFSVVKRWGTTICYHKDQITGIIIGMAVMVVYSFVPFVIIVVCNIILITRATLSYRFRKASGTKLASDERKMTKMTIIAILNSTAFLLLTMPVKMFNLSGIALVRNATMQSVHRWLTILQLSNHGINGYIYCTSGSLFLEEVLSIFGCKPKTGGRKLERTDNIKGILPKPALMTISVQKTEAMAMAEMIHIEG